MTKQPESGSPPAHAKQDRAAAAAIANYLLSVRDR
jgi:hypothetical protein